MNDADLRRDPKYQFPAACPRCGNTRVVRIVKVRGVSYGWDMVDLLTGRALLGPRDPAPGGTTWVCLACQPGWHEVHRLALEEEGWRAAMEEAVGESDFEAAKQCSHKSRDAQERQRELVKRLTAQPGG